MSLLGFDITFKSNSIALNRSIEIIFTNPSTELAKETRECSEATPLSTGYNIWFFAPSSNTNFIVNFSILFPQITWTNLLKEYRGAFLGVQNAFGHTNNVFIKFNHF